MVSKNNTIAIFRHLLFVLFLLGQCPIASGQVTYSVHDFRNGELCGRTTGEETGVLVSGRTNLRTKAGCEAAAVSMGIRYTSATVISSRSLPLGCVVDGSPKRLTINTNTDTRTACGTRHGGYPHFRTHWQNCICANGPLCSETDGTTANSAGCICGVSPCTATTGLFCVQHKKLGNVRLAPIECATNGRSGPDYTDCSKLDNIKKLENECLHSAISACSNINGTSTNSLPCLCGTKTCTPSTGLFCLASLSTCNTKIMCSVTDGSAVNSGSCACGTSDCDSSTGLFCDVHQNRSRCLATHVCPNQDGLEPNAATCKCGPTDSCDANTFCNANALEGSACSAPLDCAITVDEMFEQMPNCTRFNNRCKCTQCSRGFYTDDCSVVCPSRAVSILVDSVYLFGAFWFTLAYIVSGCYFFSPCFLFLFLESSSLLTPIPQINHFPLTNSTTKTHMWLQPKNRKTQRKQSLVQKMIQATSMIQEQN